MRAVPRTNNNDGFDGCIDEVRISKIARTSFVPVELTSFSYKIVNKCISLEWETATEINNRGFEVERSFDKIVWNVIGFVKGKGTTPEKQYYSFIDERLINSQKYYYRLKQVDFNGKIEYSKEIEVIMNPSEFRLYQNYPNPFNPTTTIGYDLKKNGNVSLKIFDLLGNEVSELINGTQNAGNYSIEFNSKNIASGVYIYILRTSEFTSSKKMLINK